MPIEKHVKIAKMLSILLDNQFEISGIKFGIDPLIGLLPILGDILPLGVTGYFVWIGYKLALPKEKLYQIVLFAVIDFAVGIVPFIGDFIDFAYKNNAKSYEIIENFLKAKKSPGVLEGEIVER